MLDENTAVNGKFHLLVAFHCGVLIVHALDLLAVFNGQDIYGLDSSAIDLFLEQVLPAVESD